MAIRNLEIYYGIYIRLIGGRTQTQIAQEDRCSRMNICKKVKVMLREGVLKPKPRSSFMTYESGPGAKAFLDRIRADREGISNDEPFFTHPKVSLSSPGPEYKKRRKARVHNIQYVVHLARSNLIFRPLNLPDSIEWGHTWETKGPTEHFNGTYHLEEWEKPVKIHYSKSPYMKETLQITLPVSYILVSWLSDPPRLECFFLDSVKKITELFRKEGYIIMDTSHTNHSTHYAFYIPLYEDYRNYKAGKLTDKIWVDFSAGPDSPELETDSIEEAQRISASGFFHRKQRKIGNKLTKIPEYHVKR